MRRSIVRLVSVLVFGGLVLGGAQAVSAEQQRTEQVLIATQAPVPASPVELDQQRAEETRQELRRLMERYPPTLGRVLKLDSTLMTNPGYLAPYPALVTFLQRHPEVPRYPGYFLNFVDAADYYEPGDPESRVRSEAMSLWRNVIQDIQVFAVFLTVALTLVWLIRSIIGHRRWLRATKVQSEVHGRLMERFHSNEELLAYVQSPAGRHFLEGLPATTDGASSGPTMTMAMPFNRILLSIQAGLVLTCGGIGLIAIKTYVIEEIAQMLLVMGSLAVALGIGFALAAAASYMLSARLGLLNTASRDRSHGA